MILELWKMPSLTFLETEKLYLAIKIEIVDGTSSSMILSFY